MEINNNIPTGQTNTSTSTSTTKQKSNLSIDDFLQIMAAEIKNQNPMGSEGGGGSGSKTDYISQLSQFTSLEQMSDISESLNLMTLMSQQQYSFGLMGKEVTLSEGEGTVKGIVEKVKFQDGYAVLQVNNKDYFLGSVVEVANSEVDK